MSIVRSPQERWARDHVGAYVEPTWDGAAWSRGRVVGYCEGRYDRGVVVQILATVPGVPMKPRTKEMAEAEGCVFLLDLPRMAYDYAIPSYDRVRFARLLKDAVKAPEMVKITFEPVDTRPQPCARCYTGAPEFAHSCRLVKA
jgi:hypothetical protein